MAPSSARSALLAAILANPADDLPRMVYADHLDECGEDEHAKMIRYQIANHETVLEEGYPNARGIFGIDGSLAFSFCRGFVDWLSGPLQALLDHGPSIVRENPVEKIETTNARAFPFYIGDRIAGYWAEVTGEFFEQGPHRTAEKAIAALNDAVLDELRDRAKTSGAET